jgi:hypothetical protein
VIIAGENGDLSIFYIITNIQVRRFSMIKKMIAAGAVIALFACSGDDGDSGTNTNTSSSSEGGALDVSSSSEDDASSSSGPSTTDKAIATFGGESAFGTYSYGYTLKAGSAEDLTPFWDIADPDCPVEEQTAAPPEKCELDKTAAILQNNLTNRYSDLHYEVTGGPVLGTGSSRTSVQLKEYNLSGEGDQAALGLDVGVPPKDISIIDGTKEFNYKYRGGAHTFRAVTDSDTDFWQAQVGASNDTVTVHISLDKFEGMGSLEETPFNLSMVKKFLWVVEYDAEDGTKNQGSLVIANFRTLIEK